MSIRPPFVPALAGAVLAALVSGAPRTAAQAPDGPMTAAEALSGLEYRLAGPAAGGRATRAAGVAGDPETFYLATASGGVWKSEDGAVTWAPIFDDQPVASVGAIAVAPSDPNVVYVGTGEANIRGNVAAGNGIYRSTDAGLTWTHVWDQQGQIGTMAVDPRDADVAFAAVLGHAFGPNPERGVYRTRDGGATWQQVLARDADTGASDVAIDPSNPRIVFAGLWQARRRPWDLVSGGPGSGLFVSRDGGTTWDEIEDDGLPDKPWGKVGVAVAPSDGRRVYAVIEADGGGLFRSDDGGGTWSHVSVDRRLQQRAWYYSTITVNPSNADEVWLPNVPMLRSIDGGRTFEVVEAGTHGDFHDLWIDPRDPDRMIAAHDGGYDMSVDGGEHWRGTRLPISQFYHVAVDTAVPYHVHGAMQDLGTARGPSNSLASGGIPASAWIDVGGGEAGHTYSDPSDPEVVYAGEYLGVITRWDGRTGQSRHVGAWPDNMSGWPAKDLKYRFQWTAPITGSPHDPRVLYHAAQVVFRSEDGGQHWSVISPDLTRNDPSKQGWAGGPITGDNTGVETYCTIFALAESPAQKDVIWAGSDDGMVHVTRDGGRNWTDVTPNVPGLPEWSTVSAIEPSPFDASTAYLVVDAHRLDDMRPYLWVTRDFGNTWTSLSSGLDPGAYLHVVREDPMRRGLLYAGTERGVAVSWNDGRAWTPLQLNMPTVAVHDLRVHDDDLVVATHGRSIWILDDLTPVRQLAGGLPTRAVHLYEPLDTIAWRYASSPRLPGNGENPPRGVVFNYWLADDADGPVTLEIVDGDGRTVRTLSSEPRPYDGTDDQPPAQAPEADLSDEAGLHRAVWDLRWEGARKIPDAKIDWGTPGTGPRALAGEYTARLRAGNTIVTQAFTVRDDPRVRTTRADQEAQLAFALEARDRFSALTATVVRVQELRTQLEERAAALGDSRQAAELRQLSDAVVDKLDALESSLHNPEAEVTYDILAGREGGTKVYSRLSPLLGFIADGDGAPTQGMREVYTLLAADAAAGDRRLGEIVDRDLAALMAAATRLGIPYVIVPK
ncbi:MAG: glycosyl hydrolase [Vicinamibacterales bacterium]